MVFKRIDHIELVPSDFQATLDFYTRVLGFQKGEQQVIEGHPPLRQVIYLRLRDTVLELLEYEGPRPAAGQEPQVGYRALALEVDSMDDAVSYLASHGVTPSWGPFDVGGGSQRAEILDPDGLPIELRQW